MFISKKFKGIYYLYYTDVTGKRVSISTHSRRKADALRFLNKFKPGVSNKVSFPETCTIGSLMLTTPDGYLNGKFAFFIAV